VKSPQIDLVMPDQGKRWHRFTAQQGTHEFTGLKGDRGRKS